MIISCNTNSLNKAIQTVQRAIISKPSTPIFSGIHVIAADNKLEIQAMDLNMAISCTIDAEISEYKIPLLYDSYLKGARGVVA